jgi:hypothetical protein
MPAKMKSACAGCGGEILFEKDSTGQEITEANSDEYANLCGTCRTKSPRSEREGDDGEQRDADFEDEHNKAMRTGGRTDQGTYQKGDV